MATLMARVKNRDGMFCQRAVKFARNHKPTPVESATSYFVLYRDENGKRKATKGTTLELALVELHRVEAVRAGSRELLKEFQAHAPATPSRTVLSEAVNRYLAELPAFGKARGTCRLYSDAVNDFQRVCSDRGTVYVEDIKREDLIAYLEWMRKSLSRQQYGSRETTLANRLRSLGTFLVKHGIKMKKDRSPLPNDPGLLAHSEMPKAPRRNPKKYSADTVSTMLAVADVDETDLIQFFLFTGFRDEEVAYCEWSDINFRAGTVNVHDKPHWGWKPKDKEQRQFDIPLPPDFVERMHQRRERQKGCELIFPNTNCRPDVHLILRVKRVARRAGIEERITLHQFRRTFGTTMARRFGVHTAQKLLGHANLATTALYLASDEEDMREVRAAAGDTFAKYVGK